MQKKILFLTMLLLIIGATLIILSKNLTQNPAEMRSLTKAICNQTNYCQDYQITCKKDKIVQLTPITGAIAQFPEDWADSRTDELKEITCG